MKAHAEITAKIIAQMETAGSNWLNPMTGDGFGLPRNAVSGHRYQGINVLDPWLHRQLLGHLQAVAG